MKLEFREINEETKGLLPDKVYTFARDFDSDHRIRVAEIDPAYADGESLSRVYGTVYEAGLNCLVVEGERSGRTKYAAVVIPCGKRAALNAAVRRTLDVRKVSFADLDYVVQATGMEYGSITPIGLPEDWTVLMDDSVFQHEQVIIGGGRVCSKITLPSEMFRKMKNAIVMEGLAKE